MSKTNKPLLAYHVGEGSEGEQVIVFATSSAAGRRKGGNELELACQLADLQTDARVIKALIVRYENYQEVL